MTDQAEQLRPKEHSGELLAAHTLMFVLTALLTATNTAAQEPISVCELLDRRIEFDGKWVAVQGLIEGGSEGSWLEGHCPPLLSQGHEWPGVIALEHRSAMRSDALRFDQDHRALNALKREYIRRTKRGDRDIQVVYHGLFQTHQDLAARVHRFPPDGRVITLGFGHLGFAPAQLIVKSGWIAEWRASQQVCCTSRAVPICEALRDISAYNDRLVTLKAEYRASEERAELFSPDCDSAVAINGTSFVGGISIVTTKMRENLRSPVHFTTSEDVVPLLSRRYKEARNTKSRLILLVTGVIQSVRRPTNDRDRAVATTGFGTMNAYPAQLVVKTIDSTSLE